MLRGNRQLTRKSGVSPACYEEVTGKLVPVEFELLRENLWDTRSELSSVVNQFVCSINSVVARNTIRQTFKVEMWPILMRTSRLLRINSLERSQKSYITSSVMRHFISRERCWLIQLTTVTLVAYFWQKVNYDKICQGGPINCHIFPTLFSTFERLNVQCRLKRNDD